MHPDHLAGVSLHLLPHTVDEVFPALYPQSCLRVPQRGDTDNYGQKPYDDVVEQ